MIKELTEEFKEQFSCLGENTKNYITFSVAIKEVITKKLKKMENKLQNHILQTKNIDSIRLMASPLSDPVDNLAEGISKIKCK